MASTITIVALPEGYQATLQTLAFYDIVFKVRAVNGNLDCIGLGMVFTVQYYRNCKTQYNLVEMAFQVNQNFQQKVLPNGCLKFTYR